MMELPSIAENFEKYSASELPKDISEEVRDVLRDAFYQGAGSVLWLVNKITKADSPAEGIAALGDLCEEYRTYEMAKIASEIEELIGKHMSGVVLVRVRREE